LYINIRQKREKRRQTRIGAVGKWFSVLASLHLSIDV